MRITERHPSVGGTPADPTGEPRQPEGGCVTEVVKGVGNESQRTRNYPADDLSERKQDVDRDRKDQLAIAQVLLAVAVAAMPTMCVMIAHVRN